jgi:hypothetical protein
MYVILRSDIAGVFYGRLLKDTRPGYYRLADCRKVWSWEGANHVEGLALVGPELTGSQITGPTRQDVRVGDGDQLIRGVTAAARERFDRVPAWLK